MSRLVHVRSGDTDTWRLDTSMGSYFIKGYRPMSAGLYLGADLLGQLEVAMSFERSARESGIDTPEPVPPVDPCVGWVSRIDRRLFRVYRWVEHRALRADDDIAEWLGRTMARIHRLRPSKLAGLPAWWSRPLWPRVTWEEWFAEARRRNRAWSEFAGERLPCILDSSARIERLCGRAPDRVTTHGDFKAHNMLMARSGPVLVDWDSVREDSAALEAGRVAYIFGVGEPEPINDILRSYADAGGDVTWAGPDLFLSVVRHDLHALFERVQVSLGELPAPWWMGDEQTNEQTIGDLLQEFPAKVTHLDQLAMEVSENQLT
nr:aminoglycoside phosphotransferase family protein [Actinopolymorpha cephalotaxi]